MAKEDFKQIINNPKYLYLVAVCLSFGLVICSIDIYSSINERKTELTQANIYQEIIYSDTPLSSDYRNDAIKEVGGVIPDLKNMERGSEGKIYYDREYYEESGKLRRVG